MGVTYRVARGGEVIMKGAAVVATSGAGVLADGCSCVAQPAKKTVVTSAANSSQRDGMALPP